MTADHEDPVARRRALTVAVVGCLVLMPIQYNLGLDFWRFMLFLSAPYGIAIWLAGRPRRNRRGAPRPS